MEMPAISCHGLPVRSCRIYDSLDPSSAHHLVHTTLQEPAVFGSMIEHWQYRNMWTPQRLSEVFGDKRTKFRIIPRMVNESSGVVWETQCQYVDASFIDFQRWIKGDQRFEETDDCGVIISSSKCSRMDDGFQFDAPKLGDFNPVVHAAYADYKYIRDLFLEIPVYKEAVDWSPFGHPEMTGEHSTFWLGSSGAHTPCHYDTYGFNLVAQLYGKKRWTLFPPDQSACLYPTRLPYEESSVFSRVNIKQPDLETYPWFANAEPVEVVLEPGHVLFVPKHWWHFVESLNTSISVNMWVNVESDCLDRVQEAIARNVVMSMRTPNEAARPEDWMVSPDHASSEENLSLLNAALTDLAHNLQPHTEQRIDITNDDLINILAHPDVVRLASQKLLEQAGII
ncbi:HSPB1-associated protein 1-like isoform X2 [Corticium candelabrum]|uniref:HSPB1-associated protein 1-like isoform X2 n=1 Tax=Corticium candelabrum TaxID=121492 RepID=UPI002E262C89|nr:HSPB1-associated protein 1-like isoform X2 [Corticium candelabrum]